MCGSLLLKYINVTSNGQKWDIHEDSASLSSPADCLSDLYDIWLESASHMDVQ